MRAAYFQKLEQFFERGFQPYCFPHACAQLCLQSWKTAAMFLHSSLTSTPHVESMIFFHMYCQREMLISTAVNNGKDSLSK